jgi:hypothetical protein
VPACNQQNFKLQDCCSQVTADGSLIERAKNADDNPIERAKNADGSLIERAKNASFVALISLAVRVHVCQLCQLQRNPACQNVWLVSACAAQGKSLTSCSLQTASVCVLSRP